MMTILAAANAVSLIPVRARDALLLLIPIVGLAACSRQQSAPAPATQPPAVATGASAPAAAPAGEMASQTVTGPVLETIDAASYTYVRVRTGSGEVWAAAPQFPVKVGDRVVIPLEMPMRNFHSQSLNRDFPLLYFVSQIAREGDTTRARGAASAPALMSGHGTTTPSAPAQVIEPIAPPAGGTSIADLWAKRKTLAGKIVTVRGRVVKFNPGILGKNWIHLQDGTGSAANNSNDITVTTAEDVAVSLGDTIIVTGTVVLDKNLGEGYAYAIVIENARVVETTKGKAGT
jgi:hypothetical protein